METMGDKTRQGKDVKTHICLRSGDNRRQIETTYTHVKV